MNYLWPFLADTYIHKLFIGIINYQLTTWWTTMNIGDS